MDPHSQIGPVHDEDTPPHGVQIAADAPGDAQRAVDVRDQLMRYDPLRTLHVPLDIQVHDGQVTLRGYVRGTIQKRAASALALTVPGVETVDNQLIADNELEVAVAMALSREPATPATRWRVSAIIGEVRLIGGQHADPSSVAAAVRAAEAVPGVRQVTLELTPPPILA